MAFKKLKLYLALAMLVFFILSINIIILGKLEQGIVNNIEIKECIAPNPKEHIMTLENSSITKEKTSVANQSPSTKNVPKPPVRTKVTTSAS